MFLEGIGAAAAAAGGIVLKFTMKRGNSATRTVTADSISSSIVNQGDIQGDANMTVNSASPVSTPVRAALRPPKRRSIGVPIGIVLILVGLALIAIGAYWDWMAVRA